MLFALKNEGNGIRVFSYSWERKKVDEWESVGKHTVEKAKYTTVLIMAIPLVKLY